MKLKYIQFLSIAFFLLFVLENSYAFITKESNKPFLFPMPVYPMVSSGFGENRSAYLHTGTDFRTYAINGIPLLAMEDGYIDTIHGHPYDYGFGLALFTKYYYKNYRSVYGHIQDLSSKYHMNSAWRLYNLLAIDSYYSIKMPQKMMPVSKGEVIAYTGERGIGVEHLHYEIRDENNNYLNSYHPDYIVVQKKEKPVFHSIYILTEGLRMGKNKTSTSSCRLKKEKNPAYKNVYRCNDDFLVDGKVYIKIRAKDNTNAINNHSLYSLTSILDNEILFQFQLDKIKKNEKYSLYSLYDMNKTHGWPYFYGYNLYLSKHYRKNAPSWITKMKNYGIIDTSKWNHGESHLIKIVAKDVVGNKSFAYVKLVKSKGRYYRSWGAGYNKEAGKSHNLSMNNLQVETSNLKGAAYLKISNTKVKKIWYLRRTGKPYRISFIRSYWKDKVWVYFQAPYSGRVAIYNQYGKMISYKYSKERKSYYASLDKSQTLFLARDISAPSFGYVLLNGPLKQEHYVIPVSDYGSGINWSTIQIDIDGVRLSREQISRWNIRYDQDRKSIYIPSGIQPNPDSFYSGKEHYVELQISDNAWNKSKKWKGFVLLKD